jgi:hypothetical protein
VDTRDDHHSAPEFGPSGYLPERAARRARKIVLRAPLGLQWVIAAVVAGLVVLVAGAVFLARSDAPPAAPWVPVAALEDLAEVGAMRAVDGVLLVGVGGRPRAFAEAPALAYCPDSNRLEAVDGRSWSLTGRGLGGVASLREHPTLVHDGRLYLDPTRLVEGPPASPDPVVTACR